MSVFDYLEAADNDIEVEFSDVCNTGDYKEILSLFDNSRIEDSTLYVDEDYFEAKRDEFRIGDKRISDWVESSMDKAFTLGPLKKAYDKGESKAESKIEKLYDRKPDHKAYESMIDKAEINDKLNDATKLTTFAGLIGLSSGVNELLGPSILAAGGSPFLNARWRGMRDRELQEAVEGLEEGYGSYNIEIDD